MPYTLQFTTEEIRALANGLKDKIDHIEFWDRSRWCYRLFAGQEAHHETIQLKPGDQLEMGQPT